ncbi:MAG: hypothetical protein VXY16_02515 [Pseudomonadota bacterium]|nr:hypothetical protein [Pseudomonadota bacterium]
MEFNLGLLSKGKKNKDKSEDSDIEEGIGDAFDDEFVDEIADQMAAEFAAHEEEEAAPKVKPQPKPAKQDRSKEKVKDNASNMKPGLADYMAGEADEFVKNLRPFLPQEVIGGSVPHVPGAEVEAGWNAAAQACGTERVHFTYTVEDGRVWYLACPSGSLASNPDSWCPLAAALPGNSEYWDKETVYLYEQEGLASALRWDRETGRIQVFLGAARTLLPKVQSMDANFVTINPEVAKIVPWRNRQLRTEKLARATAKTLLYAGLVINFIAIAILLSQIVITNFVERDLAEVRRNTEKVSTDLMFNALNALQSDTIRHMVRIQELLDHLSKIDGTLVKYEVDNGKVRWEALVPQSFSNCGGILKGCTVDNKLAADGRVKIIGTR